MKIQNLFIYFLCGILLSSCNGDSGSTSATASTSGSTDTVSTNADKTYIIRVDPLLSGIQFYVNKQPLSCVNNICKLTSNQSQIILNDKDGVFVAAALLSPKARTLVNATSTGYYLFNQILAKSSSNKKQLLSQISHVVNLSGNKNILQVYQYLGLYYIQLYKSNQTTSFYDNVQNALKNNSQIQVSKPKIIKRSKTDAVTDVIDDFVDVTVDDLIYDEAVTPMMSALGIDYSYADIDGELTEIEEELDEINQSILYATASIDELEGEFAAFQSEYETDETINATNDVYTLMDSVDGYYQSYINILSLHGFDNLDDYIAADGASAFNQIASIINSDEMRNIDDYMDDISDQNNIKDTEYLYQLMTSEMRFPSFQNPYMEGDSMLDLVSEQNDFDNTEVNLVLNIAKTQQEAYILELAVADIDYNYASDPDNTTNISLYGLDLGYNPTYSDVKSALDDEYTTRNNTVNTLTNEYYQGISNSAWPNGSYKTSCRTYLNEDESSTLAYYNGESMGLYCTSDDSAIESSTPTDNLVYSSIDLDSCSANNIYTKNGILQCTSRVIYVTNNTTSASTSLYRCVANESMSFTFANGSSSCSSVDSASAGQGTTGSTSWLYAHDVTIAGNYLFVLSETSGGTTWIQSCPIDADTGKLGSCKYVYKFVTYAGKDIMAVTFGGNSYLYANNGASVFEMQINTSDGTLDTSNIHEIHNFGEDNLNTVDFLSFDTSSNQLYFGRHGDTGYYALYYCPISTTNGELAEGGSCDSDVYYFAVGYYPVYLIFYNSALYFSYTSPSEVGYYSSYANYDYDKNYFQPSTIYSSTYGGTGLQLAEYGDDTYMYIMNKSNDIEVCDLTSSPTSGTNCIATNSGLTKTYRMAIYSKN